MLFPACQCVICVGSFKSDRPYFDHNLASHDRPNRFILPVCSCVLEEEHVLRLFPSPSLSCSLKNNTEFCHIFGRLACTFFMIKDRSALWPPSCPRCPPRTHLLHLPPALCCVKPRWHSPFCGHLFARKRSNCPVRMVSTPRSYTGHYQLRSPSSAPSLTRAS